MIGRIVSFVVALTAMAVAVGVLVVSAAFAFYALLRVYIGPSGAAACVTLAAAVVVGILAFVMFGRAKGSSVKGPKGRQSRNGLADRLTDLLSDRPVVAASAAVAAGLLAWRNPALVSTLLRAMDARASGGKRS